MSELVTRVCVIDTTVQQKYPEFLQLLLEYPEPLPPEASKNPEAMSLPLEIVKQCPESMSLTKEASKSIQSPSRCH